MLLFNVQNLLAVTVRSWRIECVPDPGSVHSKSFPLCVPLPEELLGLQSTGDCACFGSFPVHNNCGFPWSFPLL